MAPLPSKAPEQAASPAARLGDMPTAPPPGKAPEQAAGQAARLTERGAVLTMAGCFLIGLLGAAWLGWGVLAGLAFVAGCVLAAWYASPPGLLTVVVSPPLLFLGAVVLVNAMTGPGGFFLSVVLGSVVTLAGAAPWLAMGMILTVIIALARGLPRCIRDLRRELRSG
jgi:Flp pilus assembly protein TadB